MRFLVENRLGFELQEGDRQQIPLFPDLDVLATVQSLYEFRQLLATDKLHIAAAVITKTLHLHRRRIRYPVRTYW
jgi:hypothetical protein